MELRSQEVSSGGVCNRTHVLAEAQIRAAQLPLTSMSSFAVRMRKLKHAHSAPSRERTSLLCCEHAATIGPSPLPLLIARL